jgi:hypothetical protein
VLGPSSSRSLRREVGRNLSSLRRTRKNKFLSLLSWHFRDSHGKKGDGYGGPERVLPPST